MNNTLTIVAVLASGATAGSALGAFAIGGPVVMPYKGTASVEFVSQSAGAKGSLYFLGWENDGAITYAASTDSKNLGQFLFSNHGTLTGYSVDLEGVLPGQSILHFAYLITNGVSVAPTGQVTRTDDASNIWFGVGAMQSTLSGDVQKVYVEDIVTGRSDHDYNDMTFNVRSLAIPAPGGAALLAAAGLVALPRRRHERRR